MKTINALGFIEVYGLAAGIEAADAMLKSARVRLLRQHGVHPGQITLVVEGDLAACRVAVNAGVAAASRLGEVLASHVIGRPDTDTETLILDLLGGMDQPDERPASPTSPPTKASPEDKPEAKPETRPEVRTEANAETKPAVTPEVKSDNKPAPTAAPAAKPAIRTAAENKPVVPPAPAVKPVPREALEAKPAAAAPARGKFGEVLDYIAAARLGYNWKELKTHFPGLPQQVRKQLDAAVASGELVKSGARYRKPEAKE